MPNNRLISCSRASARKRGCNWGRRCSSPKWTSPF